MSAYEVTGTNVKDHDAFEIHGVTVPPARPCEKASSRLGVPDLQIEIVRGFAFKELRGFNRQIDGI